MIRIRAKEIAHDFAGKICKALIPIKDEYYLGRAKSPAICTLSSIDLMLRISQNAAIMDRIAIVGRLLSENKGIDAIINFALEHKELDRIVLCGKEVRGHLAGQALAALSRNGIDPGGKIVGALGPYPRLGASVQAIEQFRRQVKIIDLTGTTDMQVIESLVS